jgi:signal transduction histidine kinase
MRAQFRDRIADPARRYSVAVAVVALALVLRRLLLSQAGDGGPHELLLTAVAVAAWYGGRGPGVVATLLASLAVAYLATGAAWLPLELFVVEGLTLSLLIGTLRGRLRRAEALVRERDDLLAIAAHELKTPLTAIVGYTQTLQLRATREGHLNRRDQDTLRVIVGQAKRLHALIDSILDLTRLHNGQVQIVCQPMDLAGLARRVVDDVGPMAAPRRVIFHGPDTAVTIQGDRVRLEQVLRNLLDNAVKYSPASGDITVRVEQRNTEAILAICDQGIGIPEEARAQLFDRFYRADNVDRRRMQGTGIGLSITAEIVALHGGVVQVDSVPGQGSTFTIRLPLHHSAAGTATPDVARRRQSDSPPVPAHTAEPPAAKRYHEHLR